MLPGCCGGASAAPRDWGAGEGEWRRPGGAGNSGSALAGAGGVRCCPPCPLQAPERVHGSPEVSPHLVPQAYLLIEEDIRDLAASDDYR